MSDIWTPHLTVAAVIEEAGRFLLVEEYSEGRVVLNQPAGHVEENETLEQAVIRETLEESGRVFSPTAICGLYRWRSPLNRVTYLRICFAGQVGERDNSQELDEGIITTHWFTPKELGQQPDRLRSPLVLRTIDNYLAGLRYPLDLIDELTPSSI